MLRCIHCHQALSRVNQHYECENHHTFDLSRQGSLHLIKAHSHKQRGDSKTQIEARKRFLNTHAYDTILTAVEELLSPLAFQTLADCACGEGYYTAALAQRFSNQFFYGFDLSKDALKMAQRHKNLQYILANIKDIPLMDQSIDVVLSMFAPLYLEEIKRILKENGFLMVVSPAENHLLELKQALYEKVILNEAKKRVDDDFKRLQTLRVQTKLILNQSQIQDLLIMTPYYFTSPKQKVESLLTQDELVVQIDVFVELFQFKT